MATAADVPNKYDLVLNSKGYMLADTEDVKAQFGYTPTFVTRQNVQGNFGDNQQDFYLTSSQNDWTEGEQQKFYRQSDPDSRSKFWACSALDNSRSGQLTIESAFVTADHGVGVTALAACGTPAFSSSVLFTASATNLYEVSGTGTVTSRGAHGAGTVAAEGLCSDYNALRIFVAGQNKIRKYDTTAHTFADFAAVGGNSPIFHNNSLYALDNSWSILKRFDTAGTPTTLFTWQDATGTETGYRGQLASYGGKILIVRGQSQGGGELWIYDGVGVSKVANFAPNFLPWQIAVVNGVAFISGAFVTENFTKYRSAIYYYANGQIGIMWRATEASATLATSALCAFKEGLVFTDETDGRYLYYDPSTGSVSAFGTFTSSGVAYLSWLASNGSQLIHVNSNRNGNYFPSTSKATSATVMTSLFDFDSSLDKYVKAVKVDFDSATDGNGGSVDISYRLNSLSTTSDTYTSVQVGATAGTEYTIGQSCRSISIKVTLNKGTSTNGPVLKRIYVRGVPVQFAFRRGAFVIACTGRDGEMPQKLRDGTLQPLDGLSLATNLRTAATLTTPFSLTDEFGTVSSAVIEADGFQLRRIRTNEFIAVVPWREV